MSGRVARARHQEVLRPIEGEERRHRLSTERRLSGIVYAVEKPAGGEAKGPGSA